MNSTPRCDRCGRFCSEPWEWVILVQPGAGPDPDEPLFLTECYECHTKGDDR